MMKWGRSAPSGTDELWRSRLYWQAVSTAGKDARRNLPFITTGSGGVCLCAIAHLVIRRGETPVQGAISGDRLVNRWRMRAVAIKASRRHLLSWDCIGAY